MYTHRFGRKLKLPSTIAIKHGILSMMLRDELKAQTLAAKDGLPSGLFLKETINAPAPEV
jgi:hypothetical protein